MREKKAPTVVFMKKTGHKAAEEAWRAKWPKAAKEAKRAAGTDKLKHAIKMEQAAQWGKGLTKSANVTMLVDLLDQTNSLYEDDLDLVPEARDIYRRIEAAVRGWEKAPKKDTIHLDLGLRPVCLFALEECGYNFEYEVTKATGRKDLAVFAWKDGSLAADEILIENTLKPENEMGRTLRIFVAKGKALKAQNEYEFLRRQGIGIKEARDTAGEIVAKKKTGGMTI